MRRLDEIIAGLLPGLRAMVVEDADGAAGEAAPPLARGTGGEARTRKGDAHPRSSSRRMAKKATGLDAKISIKR